MRTQSLLAVVVATSCLFVGGCGDNKRADDTKATKLKERRVPVETIEVTRGPFTRRLTLAGKFTARTTTRVGVDLPGRIVELNAAVGAEVTKGAVLIRQDEQTAAAQVAQAQAGVGQAQAAVAMALNQYKRAQKLANSKVIDRARLDQARLGLDQARAALRVAQAGKRVAQTQQSRLVTHAPLSGTVLRSGAEVGEVAAPGMPLIDIADLQVMHLVVEVPERNVATLKRGDAVAVEVSALKERRFTGKIAVVPHRADTRTRTFPVEIAGTDRALRVGMMGRAKIVLSRGPVVVPLDAIIDVPTANLSEVNNVVFVVEAGKAKRVDVSAGAMEGGSVLVKRGLQGGEKLIIVGQRRVVNGDAVKVVSRPQKPGRTALGRPKSAPVN